MYILLLSSSGGPVAKMLSNHSTIAIVGDTLFVHGGMKLKHLDDLEVNDEPNMLTSTLLPLHILITIVCGTYCLTFYLGCYICMASSNP